jgi:Flp pilus assembly protein TadG
VLLIEIMKMIAPIAHRLLARTAAEERGGIAVMMALAIMPLTLLAFAAVEFGNYTTSKGDLQDALDAAAMTVARSGETDPGKLHTLGVTVLTETFGASGRTGHSFSNVSFPDQDGVVTGQATLTLNPIVASLFGMDGLRMSARSQASRLGDRLEIALVLDNTFSMLTNDRLGITKTAANNFVDTLSTAAGRTRVSDALKISLVPYSDSVRLPAGDRGRLVGGHGRGLAHPRRHLQHARKPLHALPADGDRLGGLRGEPRLAVRRHRVAAQRGGQPEPVRPLFRARRTRRLDLPLGQQLPPGRQPQRRHLAAAPAERGQIRGPAGDDRDRQRLFHGGPTTAASCSPWSG